MKITTTFKEFGLLAKENNEFHHPIFDGIVDSTAYEKSKIKILWILKEPWEKLEKGVRGGGWSVTEDLLRDGEIKNNKGTYPPMAYVSYSIENEYADYQKIPNLASSSTVRNALKSLAYINIKKFPGKTTSSWNVIEDYYRRYEKFLLKQVEELSPDVVIFGGTHPYFQKALGIEKLNDQSDGPGYIKKNGCLYIAAYHPNQRSIPKDVYVNDIVKTIKRHGAVACRTTTIRPRKRSQKMNKNLLIVGASRGIGAAVAKHYLEKGDSITSVSRTPSIHGKWIEADISIKSGVSKIIETLDGQKIDALLFMGGVWEKEAFTSGYSFENSSFEESQFVTNVNLVAPIEITKGLLKNLKRANNPRAIYMGALSGLESSRTSEVVYSASKFGLRGAIHAMKFSLKQSGIGFSVINPGFVATDEVLEDIQKGTIDSEDPIPMTDVINAIDFILSLSAHTEVEDINLFQK